ncbi:MAG: M36 family metallopeptidase, partial [Ilumatobacteraceae bacterium]
FPTNPNFVTNPDGTPVEDRAAASEDTRVLWCWISDSPECAEEQQNVASRVPWDVNPPSVPSLTTDGNNASTAISQVNYRAPDTAFDRPVSPGRDYDFAWENRWFESGCDPANFATDNDDDASTTNLFAMHNRMHDWSYYLGFTELNGNLQKSNFGNTPPDRANDPELGQSQSGRLTVFGRDNANQTTLPDGQPGITNQYLWEPLAGAFYGTCADGAYDMAIVAHEYMHAISNRMHDPESGSLGDSQGQSESWSDLAFAEYFRGFGLVASEQANPLALAPYVTGNLEKGIRNYAMNDSPLNYSNLEYDGSGTGSPHAPGEIWSAANQDIVERFNAVYDGEYPSSDLELQRACARGEKAAEDCPGNRRWAQIMFDSFLLSPTDPTMVDSRDAMLAADRLRFDGANQFELWDEFAGRGLGVNAETDDAEDTHPVPSFANPLRDDNAAVTFEAPGAGTELEVFVGDYEARGVPVADSDPLPNPDVQTGIDDTARFVPGEYELIAQADGFGAVRFDASLAPAEETVIEVPLRRNQASIHNGASATGDGANLDDLIDDTEETNWFSGADDRDPSAAEGEQVEGRTVTVELAERTNVTDVQVSAALRPADEENQGDPGTQSRFSALRSFEIYACDTADGTECSADGDYERIFQSSADGFPGDRPRPLAPDLTLRPFDVDDGVATHVRLRVVDNQCTGGPAFQGDVNQVNDPVFSNPDCDSEAGGLGRAILDPPFDEVRAAELQVFGAE